MVRIRENGNMTVSQYIKAAAARHLLSADAHDWLMLRSMNLEMRQVITLTRFLHRDLDMGPKKLKHQQGEHLICFAM